MSQSNNLQRKKEFDILRGIGITGIVLYHLFPSVFPGGFLGVPLFFVLSGYLMFNTSERRWRDGNFHILGYYKNRILKIIPPLFTMVVIVCCYLTLTDSSLLIGMWKEICSIFFGVDNWWQIEQNASYFSRLSNTSPFTHLWFLAVEIQFYLFWPFLFLFYKRCCRRINGRKACFFFLLLAILSAGEMLFLYTPGEDPSRVYYGTDTMGFSLFTGIFLGAVRQQYKSLCFDLRENIITKSIFLLIPCILFLTINGQNDFLYQGGLFIISLFYAVMINLMENQNSPAGDTVNTSLFSFLGQKSYHIYLWHYPIIILALIQMK